MDENNRRGDRSMCSLILPLMREREGALELSRLRDERFRTTLSSLDRLKQRNIP